MGGGGQVEDETGGHEMKRDGEDNEGGQYISIFSGRTQEGYGCRQE